MPANIIASEAVAKYKLFEAYGEELGRLTGSGAGMNHQEWAWWGHKSYVRWMAPGTSDADDPETPVTEPQVAD